MKLISKIVFTLALLFSIISCSEKDNENLNNELSASDIAKIRQVGDNHTLALNAVYDDLLNTKNQSLYRISNSDPRTNVNNILEGVGEVLYTGNELNIYNQNITKGESILTQANNLNDYNTFNNVLNQSFSEISNYLVVNNLQSLAIDNYMVELKNIMLNSFNNTDINMLKAELNNKFNIIQFDNDLTLGQKAILLSTLDLYKDSLIYWEANLDTWFALNDNNQSKIKQPNINYTVIGAADAIGAVRGGIIGAGALAGGIGAIPGAICGGLAGGAQGSALAAGAQLLAWAWESIW